jgi:nitrite reductase (NADH) small subunit
MNAMSNSNVWITLCQEADLVVGSGVCALLESAGQMQQVAIFREVADGPVYVIGNYDPLGGANVLSRGIIGSIGDKLVVASPLYKQHYSLQDGQCLEDPSVCLPAWPARVVDGQVQIQVA